MSGVRLERRIWLSLLAVAAFTALAAAVMTQTVARQDFAWPMSVVVLASAFLALGLTLLWLMRRLADWIMRPLAGASTVVEALRDGDFSLRLREKHLGPLDELAHSINMLAESMRMDALNRRESGLLLGKILEEIDLPVLAFRDDGHLTLSNPAARKLIGLRLHEGVDAASLGLAELLEQPGRLSEGARSTRLVFPGGSGRFVVRRRSFRLGGVPHRLLVLTEVGSVLDAERNDAWQSLVRVMSHEINNSLSPIKSLAETWNSRLRDPSRDIEREQLADSLALIARRSGGLSRFVGIYAGLAKLPDPSRETVDLQELLEKICALESRVPISLDGTRVSFDLDPDQFEQAMINLLRNAVDAVADRDAPEVLIRCIEKGDGLVIEVVDNGPGPPESKNLFVPFFTTKPNGSGIGLLLVRRIAELHGGTFDLDARDDGTSGAVARLWFPGP